MDALHRIVTATPITPFELRVAGLFAIAWFLMDAFWFVCTAFHRLGF
jgi:hypothetical protein